MVLRGGMPRMVTQSGMAPTHQGESYCIEEGDDRGKVQMMMLQGKGGAKKMVRVCTKKRDAWKGVGGLRDARIWYKRRG